LIEVKTKQQTPIKRRFFNADGCRDPLLTWNGILIDGHNRYEICTKHGLPFSILEKDFTDSGAAKIWMIDNQNGRRNLTDGWKFQLSQAKKEILLDQGKIAQVRKPVDSVLSTIDKTDHNTRATIANDLGWSTGKVAMADKVWKEAIPEIKERVLSGEISINEAYKAIKAGNTHVSNNSGENEWYTPEKFIEAARSVMGSIDIRGDARNGISTTLRNFQKIIYFTYSFRHINARNRNGIAD
jgi:hypothetical protein